MNAAVFAHEGLCANSPRRNEPNECQMTGGDTTCITMFCIWVLAAIFLLTLLVVMCRTQSRSRQCSESLEAAKLAKEF